MVFVDMTDCYLTMATFEVAEITKIRDRDFASSFAAGKNQSLLTWILLADYGVEV
jgi:hypothetical protein